MKPSEQSLISAISRIYLALTSLALLYFYAAYTQWEKNATLEQLAALDKLLVLRAVANRKHGAIAKLTGLKVLDYYGRAKADAYLPWPDGQSPYRIDLLAKRGFGEKPIPNSRVLQDMPMRFAVGARCAVAVITGHSGARFNFATFRIVGKVYWVSSEQTSLVSLGRCATRYGEEFNAIMFRLEDGEVAFALPKRLEKEFPIIAPQLDLGPMNFQEIETFKKRLPAPIAKYAEIEEPLVIIHQKAVEHYLLQYANDRLGRFHAHSEFDSAVSKVFDEAKHDSFFIGMKAESSLIIRWGPFILLILSWELWRRVRLLRPHIIASEAYWNPLDSRDLIGLIGAYSYSIWPTILTVLVAYFFVQSQGLYAVVGSRILSVDSLLTFEFPHAPAPGWLTTDRFAILLAIPIAIQLGILLVTSVRLIAIANANRRR